MYIRNFRGKLEFIDEKKFATEREFYIAIWKIKYNVDIAKNQGLEKILDFVSGEKNYV